MDFYYKKLPLESFNELRPFPVTKVKPYQLLLAPVYVFLHKNSKFLALRFQALNGIGLSIGFALKSCFENKII